VFAISLVKPINWRDWTPMLEQMWAAGHCGNKPRSQTIAEVTLSRPPVGYEAPSLPRDSAKSISPLWGQVPYTEDSGIILW
jgi:hypothetical protein